MTIVITILKSPESVAKQGSSKTFDVEGGTIGRGDENTWILEDPERYLSSCHCQISCENGLFYITDRSTNGTFYNGSEDPLGKGSKQALRDSDRFVLGDYEFSVELLETASAGMVQTEPYGSGPFDNAAAAPASQFGENDLFGGQFSEPQSFASGSDFGSGALDQRPLTEPDSLFGINSAETDPLAALDKAQGGQSVSAGFESQNDSFSAATHSDQANPMNEQISWPEALPDNNPSASGGIPDDWDEDISAPPALDNQMKTIPDHQPVSTMAPVVTPKPSQSAPVRPARRPAPTSRTQSGLAAGSAETQAAIARQQTLETVNAKIQAELNELKQQLNGEQRVNSVQAAVDTTLVDALGFHEKNLSTEEISRINQLSGEVLREMVSGLMQVLGSRSSIKNEFRMNVTTIQPVENNPLKFSANIDDALENMFLKQGNAYKKPLEAVSDGFDGIAEHQIAILAGIKEAFKTVIERFDPIMLEERFSKQNKGGLIPGSQKAKNWDSFLEYYEELAGDMDRSFQYLYGDGFVRAYESQLQSLAVSKKSKQPKND